MNDQFPSDMTVKSEGTFGAGKAEVVIKMTRPDGQVDQIIFHQIYVRTPEDSKLVIYEEDDDIFDGAGKHVTRIKQQNVKIELEGSLQPVQGAQLFEVRLDIDDNGQPGHDGVAGR